MRIKMTTKQLVQVAVVAALYAVLTSVLAPISFGAVQFRVSEMMVFLAYFNPIYIIGLTLGCFITNILTSPYFILDGIFGTIATLISVVAIYLTSKAFKGSQKGLILASIWPTLFNGVIIGWIIYTVSLMNGEITKNLSLLFSFMASVAVGEFIIVTIVGVPVVTILMNKYKEPLNRLLQNK